MSNFQDFLFHGIPKFCRKEFETLHFYNCPSTGVDKRRLFEAVSLRREGTEAHIGFGKKLLFCDKITVNPLKVDKLGDIPIPVSVQDIERLKEISKVGYCGKGYNRVLDCSKKFALQIDASKLASTISDDLSLTSMVMHHLDLPSELMNVQAKLDQLILYESGGHYQCVLESGKEYGSFGTMILQLPVEGGHEGGRFNVEYQGKELLFENEEDSDRSFYTCVFYENCKHSMEPVKCGARLTLQFNLVWSNAKIVIPQDFPFFLTALKEIKETLSSWMSDGSADPQIKNMTNMTISKESHAVSNTEAIVIDDVLHFVLEEKYDAKDFGFRRLRGKDRELAQLFQCCCFLDVHLAVVTQTVATIRAVRDWHSPLLRHLCRCQNYKKIKSSTKISRWLDSEDVPRKLSCDFNLEKHGVGLRRKLPTSNSIENYLEDERLECGEDCYGNFNTISSKKYIQHFILVIWPKRESFRMYCRHGLDALLKELEFKSSSRWLEDSVQKATEDLGKMITLCSSDPWLTIWNQTALREGELTERLLRLCIDLQAREEGLALLKVLSLDFQIPQEERTSDCQEIFEGIKTEQVAEAIVEFECRVTGWNDCADAIEKILSPNRIFQQLVPVMKMARSFLNVDCSEGAKLVGDCISSAFSGIDKSQALRMEKADIHDCMELIILLEADPKTANQERQTSVASFFSKLEFSMQCDLVLKLEARTRPQSHNSESRKMMFQALCKALTYCELGSPLIKENNVVDLIFCYSRIGNAEWLQSLLSNVVRAQVTSEKSNDLPTKTLLQKVISSPRILQLDLSSDLGESLMKVLVDSQLTLNIHQLTTILIDVWYDTSPIFLRRLPSTVTIISHFCSVIILRLKKNTTEMLSQRRILEVIKICIELGNASLTKSLLKQVCAKISTWGNREKYSLFVDLIFVSDVWGALSSKSKLITMQTFSSLVPTLIMGMCRPCPVSKSPIRIEVLFNCINFFFLIELNGFEIEPKINAQTFEPLIAKLPVSLLMELVLQLYKSEAKKSQNIKTLPVCFNFYRDTSRLFFTLEFVPLVSSRTATPILDCLLWLEDEQCWQSFALSVSAASPSFFLRVFLEDLAIQRALKDSCPAVAAFLLIVDNWSLKSAFWKEPLFSWNQPKAVLPDHPEVEAFLHSSLKSMTYKKFTRIAEARDFAKYLSYNFSVSVVTSASGKQSQCIITKTRKQYERTKRLYFNRKAQMVELVKECLGQANLKAKPLRRQPRVFVRNLW